MTNNQHSKLGHWIEPQKPTAFTVAHLWPSYLTQQMGFCAESPWSRRRTPHPATSGRDAAAPSRWGEAPGRPRRTSPGLWKAGGGQKSNLKLGGGQTRGQQHLSTWELPNGDSHQLAHQFIALFWPNTSSELSIIDMYYYSYIYLKKYIIHTNIFIQNYISNMLAIV